MNKFTKSRLDGLSGHLKTVVAWLCRGLNLVPIGGNNSQFFVPLIGNRASYALGGMLLDPIMSLID